MRVWLRKNRGRLGSLLLFVVALVGVGGAAYADRVLNGGVAWGAQMLPMENRGSSRMAINTFLDREPDPAKVEQSLKMAADAGFKYVRQAFPWYDIEIAAKGDFEDRRGPTAHSAWDKYDFIVNTANKYGLELLVRLDGTPLWASPSGQEQNAIGYYKGPPANNQDFADFAATVARRYGGKVHYYQIWNEPNLAVEWASTPDAVAYTALLKAGYTAIKEADPKAAVVMAGLAPTTDRVEIGGNQDELVYLQQMYYAGAAPYFDIGSVMIYGLGYSPDTRFTDLRLPGDNRRVNFSRVRLARAVMVANGDGFKPLWPSEYGWISMPGDWAGKPSSWGASVDEVTQAKYLVAGYERAQAEWPWIGPMFVWHLRDPDPPEGEPQQFFAILNADFSPRPAYTALADYAKRYPIADTGAYLPSDPAATITAQGTGISFSGTRLDLVYQYPGAPINLSGTLDGKSWAATIEHPTKEAPDWQGTPWPYQPSGNAARSTLAQGLSDGDHSIGFSSDQPLQVFGFVVAREQQLAWLFPAIEGLLALIAIGAAVWFTSYFAARK